VNIQQVQEFRLFDRRDEKQLVIVRFYRNTFVGGFFVQKSTQKAEIISSDTVSEEFAQIVLDQALICLPKEDIEITKLSTGTEFNYPTPHV
jgi:hypothetical protein